MMGPLNVFLWRLKDNTGMSRTQMAELNGFSKQYLHQLFQSKGMIHLCRQKFVLDKVIDNRISKLLGEIEYLKRMKIEIVDVIESEARDK